MENHGVLCQSIERLLRSHGFQVKSFADAASALEHLEQARGHCPDFDLLICDFDLPDLNVCHLLRLTASDASQAGPNAVLLCPTDINLALTGLGDVPKLVAVVGKPLQRAHLLRNCQSPIIVK